MILMTLWGALAIYYSVPSSEQIREILALGFIFFGAVMLGWHIFSKKGIRTLGVFAAGLLMLLAWWSTILPQQDRDWAPEYAKPAHATIDGNLVTIHNIRNFAYKSETDFAPQYYSKTFDLKSLDSVDLIASYWMGDAIAHIC
jgi:hypothetical protein